jgi:hypothetical protein
MKPIVTVRVNNYHHRKKPRSFQLKKTDHVLRSRARRVSAPRTRGEIRYCIMAIRRSNRGKKPGFPLSCRRKGQEMGRDVKLRKPTMTPACKLGKEAGKGRGIIVIV